MMKMIALKACPGSAFVCLGHRHQLEVGCYEPLCLDQSLCTKPSTWSGFALDGKKECVGLLLLGMGRQKVSYEGGPTPN